MNVKRQESKRQTSNLKLKYQNNNKDVENKEIDISKTIVLIK